MASPTLGTQLALLHPDRSPGGPIILAQTRDFGPIGYQRGNVADTSNITFAAGANTMYVERPLAVSFPQIGLQLGLKRPRVGPPIIQILQQSTSAPATVNYTLSST